MTTKKANKLIDDILKENSIEIGIFISMVSYEYYEVKIDIELDRRYIIIQNDYYDSDYACYIPDIIYDLIKADLVEKVE